jgi:hypothetical protein
MVGALRASDDRSLQAPSCECLYNVVREPRRTCRVCGTPVGGFELCWRCREHQDIAGVADIVGPLTYAIDDTEWATVLRRYKDHAVRSERERCGLIVAELLRVGITLHERCFAAVAGLPVSVRVVIPSLTSRPGVHPLTSIARSLGLLEDPVLMPAPEAMCDRALRMDKFTVDSNTVAGRHVLVLDDVWTTGSNAQSAALNLRRAGATAVSVMAIGRWLNPRNSLSQRFIRDRLSEAYDPHVCPVTGGSCPSDTAGSLYGSGSEQDTLPIPRKPRPFTELVRRAP